MAAPNESIFGIRATKALIAEVFADGNIPRAIWVHTPGTLAVTYHDGTTDTFAASYFVAGNYYPMSGIKAITGTPTLVGKICF